MDDHIYRDDFADNAGDSAASTVELPLTSPPAARARVSDQGSAPAERPALVPAGRALFAVPRRPPEQGGQGAGGGGIGTQGSPPESRREVDVPPPAGAAESGGGRDPAVARCPGCRGRVSATQPGRGSQCALCGGGWGRGGWAHECSTCNALLCKACAVATSENGGGAPSVGHADAEAGQEVLAEASVAEDTRTAFQDTSSRAAQGGVLVPPDSFGDRRLQGPRFELPFLAGDCPPSTREARRGAAVHIHECMEAAWE